MRATLSRNGRKTTTRVARIRRSTTRHRRPLPPNSPQQAITLRSVIAPRAGLLLTPPERAYSCRDSNPRWGILQWQVTGLQVIRGRWADLILPVSVAFPDLRVLAHEQHSAGRFRQAWMDRSGAWAGVSVVFPDRAAIPDRGHHLHALDDREPGRSVFRDHRVSADIARDERVRVSYSGDIRDGEIVGETLGQPKG